MNLAKKTAILLVLGFTTLLASESKNVSTLVYEINTTNDLHLKGELLKKLDNKLKTLDKEEFLKAKKIVATELKL